MYCNSIYRRLTNLAGFKDKRKIGIAYTYSLLKNREDRVVSKNPLADEGQNVFNGLGSIGHNTLYFDPERYIDIIKSRFENDNHLPVKGTVEEKVLDMADKFGIEDTFDIVGSSLAGLLNKKPNFGKSVYDISAGQLQRNEQKEILKVLSKY